MKKTLWQRFNEWRQSFLFQTAKEAEASRHAAMDAAFETAKFAYEQKNADAELKYKAALDLFVALQEIKMDVNGRSQLLEITLLLNRKTLRLVDVTDAARLLAGRTEIIYKEAIQKRLATLEKQEQQTKRNQ